MKHNILIMKRYKIKFSDGHTEVHLDNPLRPGGDNALCGHDLCGDFHLGWNDGELTDMPITCKDCLNIVIACQNHRFVSKEMQPDDGRLINATQTGLHTCSTMFYDEDLKNSFIKNFPKWSYIPKEKL